METKTEKIITLTIEEKNELVLTDLILENIIRECFKNRNERNEVKLDSETEKIIKQLYKKFGNLVCLHLI